MTGLFDAPFGVAGLSETPDGMIFEHIDQGEAEFLYEEIFGQNSYRPLKPLTASKPKKEVDSGGRRRRREENDDHEHDDDEEDDDHHNEDEEEAGSSSAAQTSSALPAPPSASASASVDPTSALAAPLASTAPPPPAPSPSPSPSRSPSPSPQSPAVSYDDIPVVLDVGANIGLFALWALREWPKARVLSLEPLPPIAAVLQRNLQTSGYISMADGTGRVSRATVLKVAAGAEDGTAEFHFFPTAPGESTRYLEEAHQQQKLVYDAARARFGGRRQSEEQKKPTTTTTTAAAATTTTTPNNQEEEKEEERQEEHALEGKGPPEKRARTSSTKLGEQSSEGEEKAEADATGEAEGRGGGGGGGDHSDGEGTTKNDNNNDSNTNSSNSNSNNNNSKEEEKEAGEVEEGESVSTESLQEGEGEGGEELPVPKSHESMSYRCEVRTLSTIIRENRLSRIDLLKIDVEGDEENVLLGLHPSEDWPLIKQVVIEVHDLDGRLDRIRKLLVRAGFSNIVVDRERSTTSEDGYYRCVPDSLKLYMVKAARET